ncbi:MAG: TIGR02266 family protein [Deltaproteobacteria bacterium]|nr:TIGR02266 family protein [Deltaproteobacteria bacterium]
MNRKERRRVSRKAVRLEIYYSTPMDIFTSLSQNLNEGGIFIETDRPSPIGTVVEIKFYLPGDHKPIETHGLVVWSTTSPPEKDTGHPRAGMGIEFESLNNQDKERINKFIRDMKG